ncbi:MAG: YidC/Oxa1 family membrane protein insertase [Ruminococcaceae bacterium]|nr:YidC/Oxa1 family membrane protein insertase [Oscillospiraceae bacterium]
MILAFSLMDIIRVPFGYILEWLYNWTANYGVALILFSLIVKLLLLYPSAKGKKNMMKMSRMAPQLKQLEKKYGDDKEAYQRATVALYKEEGISPTGGCLWTLLPLLILIPLYTVIRQPMVYLMHLTMEQAETIVEIIKAGGIELGKQEFYHQMIAANYIPQFLPQIREALPELADVALEGINFDFLGINLGMVPNFKIWAFEVYNWANVGLFLLPVFSAGTQFLSSLLTQKLNSSVASNEKGEKDKASADAVNQTSKSLLYMMPLMSLWIGFVMPAALSIYWIAQAVFSTLQEVAFTAIFRKGYDEEDARRQEIALQKAMEEAEKERIRALRRAENPDGITENTSKKKQKLKQRELADAAAREYAAKQRASLGLEPEEDLPLSGIADRPFCKGRAYQPDRYGRNTYDAADE